MKSNESSFGCPTSCFQNSSQVPTSCFQNSSQVPTSCFQNSSQVPTSCFQNSSQVPTSCFQNSSQVGIYRPCCRATSWTCRERTVRVSVYTCLLEYVLHTPGKTDPGHSLDTTSTGPQCRDCVFVFARKVNNTLFLKQSHVVYFQQMQNMPSLPCKQSKQQNSPWRYIFQGKLLRIKQRTREVQHPATVQSIAMLK